MKYIVLMGAPGAGKGTQARLLAEALGLPQVATGDLFRRNLKNKTELGQLVQAYLDRGDLAPDDVTVDMVRTRLAQPDCSHGAILDGFPRTLPQAAALKELVAELGGRINVVPAIHVDIDILVTRLLKRANIEGRADDNRETIENRMRVYEHQTAPLIDYYQSAGLLVLVDGDQTIEQVHKALLQVVKEAA